MIEKELRLDLTYDEMDSSIDNLWSVLFTTGYLTHSGRNDGNIFKLRIPNEEIREIFRVQIREWFKRTVNEDKSSINALWTAFSIGDAEGVEKALNGILSLSISVFDTAGTEKEKEKYYHALLTGLLIGKGTWGVKSNDESGDGRSDILIYGIAFYKKRCRVKVEKLSPSHRQGRWCYRI